MRTKSVLTQSSISVKLTKSKILELLRFWAKFELYVKKAFRASLKDAGVNFLKIHQSAWILESK